MDLKAWHCGVCSYKSMLRPEVVDHCAKLHGYRFQFKCRFCPFRGSVQTAVAKHQSERHSGVAAADVVHIYYKERSLQSDEEGNPLWKKQQSLFNTVENIKMETLSMEQPSTKSPSSVNLSIVKQEADDVPANSKTLEEKYGELCEPKGESYLCPLCKMYDEESKEVFLTHLHEELKYRRFGCGMCSHKTFSISRITQHCLQEHKIGEINKNCLGGILELPNDSGIEMWIEKLIKYQDKIMEDNKKSRKALEEAAEKVTSQKSAGENPIDEATEKLIETYGSFGTAKGNSFVCPKCGYETPEDTKMYEHLEMELGKNRWACSRCPEKFQLYHEAQQHCSGGRHEQFAHVTSASKDPAERAMWIESVLHSQRVAFTAADERVSISEPGSLLVVRYEEEATATEPGPLSKPKSRKRKRKSLAEDDSDGESPLVIAEKSARTRTDRERKCPHCDFRTVHPSSLHAHVLRHYNLRPYNCYYCDFNGYKANVDRHFETEHPDLKVKKSVVPIPNAPPAVLNVQKICTWIKGRVPPTDKSLNKTASPTKPVAAPAEESTHVCLLCEVELAAQGCDSHHASEHADMKRQIVARGDLIRRCDVCMALRIDPESLQEHHAEAHADLSSTATYTIIKAGAGRDVYCCDHCERLFPKMCDLKCHHEGSHASLQLSYTKKQAGRHTRADAPSSQGGANKRKRERSRGESSGVAKKSTTKLPFASRTVARKSTSKLPHTDAVIDSSSDEYDSDLEISHYGCRPTPVREFAHIRTSMPIFNTTMPTTVEKFSAVINLTPSIVIEDIIKNRKAPT